MIQALLLEKGVMLEATNVVKLLHDQGNYGTLLKSGNVQLSLLEAAYLFDAGKIVVKDKKELSFSAFFKKCTQLDKGFSIRYAVFKDLRDKGYVVKTALKFGAEMRVYDKGVAPGQDHSRWIVYPVHETETFSWYDFSAKNRVAHSTKKRLLIGIVDDESDVTYYEIVWSRP